MRKTYEITLTDDNDNAVIVNLRLTIGGQINLQTKFKKDNALNIIFDAIDNVQIMSAVLTEALNYAGNTNKIKTGTELYDMLVDNGFCGTTDFVNIMTNIALNSGLINKDQFDAINNMADEATSNIGKDEANSKNA